MRTMKLLTLLIAMSFLALSSRAGDALRHNMTIAPHVQLVPLNAEQFPNLAVQPHALAYRESLSVLVNDSARAITGLTTIWKYTDVNGESRGFTVSYDSYALANLGPIGAPHSKRVIGDEISFANALETGRDVSVSVDVVIFADGELVGPDTLHFAEDIQSRWQAAHHVANHLKAGLTAGKSLETISAEVLRAPRPTPLTPGAMDWTRRYLSDIQTRQRLHSQLGHTQVDLYGHLAALPEPPAFFRAVTQ
jgi:hypothetical protein